jgi:hypothetical protein
MTPSDQQRLPRFDDTRTLTAEAILGYQENGFVLLRELASRAEVDAYRPIIQNVVREKFQRQEREGRTREVLTVIYYADGTQILRPDSEYRRVDMEAFHPGQAPGDPAASPLNPLLYP